MEELEKWVLVNKAETVEELQEALIAIAENGKIQGRQREWDAEQQAKFVRDIYNGFRPFNNLTRSYGIRQQVMYLMYYARKIG